ncbi:MAG: MFS transporter [Elusimicrobia bacterium]|nr:MFS transporter [Elusimicrobiota bacterium]
MRLILALSLLAASWHPAAAAGVAQAAGASRAGGQAVPVVVVTPFLGGLGTSGPVSSLGIPQASPWACAQGRFGKEGTIRTSLSGLGRGAPLPLQPAQPLVLGAALGVPGVAPGLAPAAPSEAPLASPAAEGREAVLPAGVAAVQGALALAPLAPAQSPAAGQDASGERSESAAAVAEAERLSGIFDGAKPFLHSSDPVEAGPSSVPTGSGAVEAVGRASAAPSGRTLAAAGGLRLLPADKGKKTSARRSLVGTGIFKVGMEALGVSMPLIALTFFGSAVWMANMAVTWGISMTFASMLAGGWMDRKPVHKVMSKAMVVQAAAVAGILGLFIAGLANPLLVIPLYAVAGASMGVVVTGRNLLPAKLLGGDQASLGKFNALTHLVYEIAGTIAPLLVGVLIQKIGLVSALFLHPPAFLLAAWMFRRIRYDGDAPGADVPVSQARSFGVKAALRGLWSLAKNAVADVKAGSRLMLGDRGLRWLGLMLLGPMIVHRVFEQMLVPFFAKTVLAAPQQAAWIVSSSNFGELIGAVLLLKAISSTSQNSVPAHRWVKPMALGTLAAWALVFTGNPWILLPLVLAMSVGWAANDINITSHLQSRLPEESAGKAMGFLMAAELAAILGVSYLLGFLFDAVPGVWSLSIVSAALTAAALFFWRGQKNLRDAGQPLGAQKK